MEEGYFKREGLEVSLSFTGNDDQTFAAVASGAADFGIGDPAFAAISRAKGFPAKVIGTLVGGVAIWGVTKREDLSVLKRPEDLRGLRIGTFPAPSTNYTLMHDLVDSAAVGTEKFKIVQAPIGAQIALLESGEADIAMVLEPAASLAESNGYKVVYSSPQFHGKFAFTGVTTTEDVLKGKSREVSKFIRSLQLAIEDCRKDPGIAERVSSKLFPNLSAEVVRNAVRRMIDEKTFPDSIAVDPVGWNRALEVRRKVGDLSSAAKLEGVVDNSFADNAINGTQDR
jgi:NitT/TauT family transport system substrate-binding protein